MDRSKSRDIPFSWGVTGVPDYVDRADILDASATYKNPEYWLKKYDWYYANIPHLRKTAPSVTGVENITWSSNGMKANNHCLHYKSRNVNLPFLQLTAQGTNPNYSIVWYHYRNNIVSYYPYSIQSMGIPNIDYLASRARAWHSMQPRFEGRMDLLNFLFELKDFKDIVKHIFKYRSTLDKLRKASNAWRGLPPDLAKQRTRPDHALASANLLNQLMIQPLVRDLGNICQQMNILVSEAQQQFSDNGSELQSSHFSEELQRIGSPTQGTAFYKWQMSGEVNFTTFTATLRYKYSYSMRPTFLAWMKYWGLSGSFNTMWNSMPFTFVADYFVQIGNSIRAMEHDPNVKLSEFDYCESLKTRYIKGTFTSGDASNFILIVDGKICDYKKDIVLSGLDASVYRRIPCDPYYGPAPPKFKLPSGQQALNMASLLRCLI